MLVLATILGLCAYGLAYKVLFEDGREFVREMLWFVGMAWLEEIFPGLGNVGYWTWRSYVWIATGPAVFCLVCWVVTLSR